MDIYTCISMGYIPHGCRWFFKSPVQFLVLSLAALWDHRVVVRGPYLFSQRLERRSKLNCNCGWKFSSYVAYTKENLRHREGHDLVHPCQRGGTASDNPQEYHWGCSSSSLWSSVAAAKKPGHKEDGASWGRGCSPPWVSWRNDPALTAQHCSPAICCPAASQRGRILCAPGEGSSGLLPLPGDPSVFPCSKERNPSHCPGFQRVGWCSAVRKRSLATALVTVPGFLERAFGDLRKRGWEFHRADRIYGKIWLEPVVCTLGREQLHLETPAPQGPWRSKLNVKFLLSKLGLELCVQTRMLIVLSSCPKKAESLVLLVLKTPK